MAHLCDSLPEGVSFKQLQADPDWPRQVQGMVSRVLWIAGAAVCVILTIVMLAASVCARWLSGRE